MPWFRGQRSIRAVEPSGIGTCPAVTATIRARFNSPSPLGLTRSPTNRAGPDGPVGSLGRSAMNNERRLSGDSVSGYFVVGHGGLHCALSRRRKIRIRSLEAAICLNLHTGSVGILLRENCFPSQPTEACNAAIGRWLLPSRMVVLVQAPLLIHIQA